jgi:HAD superfamily hydrolase (TIGR01509 family)
LLPYSRIDTVFLDVGNTLISIDFDWVASELTARGFPTDAQTLRRAEAAARPAFAHQLFVEGLAPGADVFRAYLLAMLLGLKPIAALPAPQLDALLVELRAVLRPDGRASVLWRSVMPRVPEALARLRDELGLTLVVVSNSDGSVERSLETAGLRPYFTAVLDSAIVGFEKPDARIFHAALEASGANPDRTLHVGDIYHADVAGARAAGLHAVLLDPFEDWRFDDGRLAPVERLSDVWAVADHLARARGRGGRD